jgi:NAD(P)-dependent dehydrogenase (short-subunit alcohol dehydrogenase family)
MEKNVLVTGSASGLGKEIALYFAEQGYRVFAGVRRPEDAEEMSARNPAITPVMLDVSNEDHVRSVAEFVDRECGEAGLSTLINAAGYAFYAPIEYTTQAEVTALFDVVTFAPYRLTNAFLPALKRFARRGGERGKVLNIVSWASLDASPFVGFYAAAKAALLRLTQAQFFELERFEVDAIAIVPGLMQTPFINRVEGQIRETIARLPEQGKADYAAPLAHMASLSTSAPQSPLVSKPSNIAKRIFAISLKQRPKYQYDLGVDTKLVQLLNRWLPFRLLHAIKRRLFGLNVPVKDGSGPSKLMLTPTANR